MKKQKKRRNHYARCRHSHHIHVPARGIKVVEGGKDGLFVAMPSRKTQDGYKDICFPVTAEFRSQLYSAVLDTYHQTLAMAQAAPTPQAAPAQPEPAQAGPQMSGM